MVIYSAAVLPVIYRNGNFYSKLLLKFLR